MVGPEIQNRVLENYEWEFEVHCVPHFSAEISKNRWFPWTAPHYATLASLNWVLSRFWIWNRFTLLMATFLIMNGNAEYSWIVRPSQKRTHPCPWSGYAFVTIRKKSVGQKKSEIFISGTTRKRDGFAFLKRRLLLNAPERVRTPIFSKYSNLLAIGHLRIYMVSCLGCWTISW